MRGVRLLVASSTFTLTLAGQVRLTSSSGGGERQPVLSADGTMVAYVAVVAGVREVCTVPVSGGAPVRRTTNAEVRLGGTTVFDAWPSLSISDDGNRVAYWTVGGVRVLDVAANTDTLVSTASLLPYPQVSGDGARVVFQDLVSGDLEVFVVSAGGGGATQLTTGSGPGRRLPHLRGELVVFQRPVGEFEEVFVHDLATRTTRGPLSANSGRGNRYARLTHDAGVVVYEAVVDPGASKEVFAYDMATSTTRQVTSASLRGDRLAAPTADGEAYFERSAVNREVQRVELSTSVLAAVTTGSGGGHRRVSGDRHGAIAVYQAPAGDTMEVFARVLAYPPTFTPYGQHGVPSTGVLTAADSLYRRTFVLALRTSLPPGSGTVLLIGAQPLALPIPGASNNFLYVDPLVALPTVLDAQGVASARFASPPALGGGGAFAQWAVFDPPANSFGWVTTKGVRVHFR